MRIAATPLRTMALAAVSALAMFAAHPYENAGEETKLWNGTAPGSEGAEGAEITKQPDDYKSFVRVQNIHEPSITAYLPPADIATGAGIIVAPGGGHEFLVIEKEGYEIAAWLNSQGIAAFILKYRLPRDPTSNIKYGIEEHATADALRAVRLVRSRAGDYNIDPDKVGVMGFSAGAEVAAFAETNWDLGHAGAADPLERVSSRPDFTAIVYPGPVPNAVPDNAPPSFLICSYDDRFHLIETMELYTMLQEKRVPAEVHIFASGGHGWGLREKELPVRDWPDLFMAWMQDQVLRDRP